ncbi:MAG TPA: nitroreductase family deazaflavin-dependent oxidoreductase [Nitrososphaerales archaeon]|nr:nitroreductase family deazaflavin-dependent oxidoreductase [Nitrososphaerales archaeon]
MAQDWNAQTISEFRRNHGQVGGYFKGAPLLLLHTTGARTGKQRVNPVMYLKDGGRLVVFASNGGAPKNPDWYYNLKAHPDIEAEVGDDLVEVHVEEALGAERDELYGRQSALYPRFGEYQRGTKRRIPVMVLTPRK